MKVYFLILIAIFAFTGCRSAATKTNDTGPLTGSTEIREVSPAEAQPAVAKAYSQFIDVRTPEEYAEGHAARTVNIPLDTIAGNLDKFEKSEPIYLICRSGSRSKKAGEILRDAGFKDIYSVAGGTEAWKAAGLPMETKPPHNTPTPKP